MSEFVNKASKVSEAKQSTVEQVSKVSGMSERTNKCSERPIETRLSGTRNAPKVCNGMNRNKAGYTAIQSRTVGQEQ